MSADPVSRAVAAATVTLPYAEFQALLTTSRDAESDAADARLIAREAGIKAAFYILAAVLDVGSYEAGDGETEVDACLDEVRNILRAAGLTDADGEVLDGPAMHAMWSRLARLEAVADAAREVERLLRQDVGALANGALDRLRAAQVALPVADEVVF